MSQLLLKKKESRLFWQVLMRGIIITDRMNKRKGGEDHADYQALRGKVIAAWKSGVILGGIRPKKHVQDIMPDYILNETELAHLKKAGKRDRATSKDKISVPRKQHSA